MEYLFRIYDHIMSKPEPFAWAERSEHKNNEEYIARLKAQYDGNIMEHLLRAKRLMDASATLSGSKYPQQLAQDEACATLLGEAYSYARDNGVAAWRKNSVGRKIPSITKGPGSYTQLDVYKRQAQEGAAGDKARYDRHQGYDCRFWKYCHRPADYFQVFPVKVSLKCLRAIHTGYIDSM